MFPVSYPFVASTIVMSHFSPTSPPLFPIILALTHIQLISIAFHLYLIVLTPFPPHVTYFSTGRDVAQSGSAPEWGSGGRKFKSSHPDQLYQLYFNNLPNFACVVLVVRRWCSSKNCTFPEVHLQKLENIFRMLC